MTLINHLVDARCPPERLWEILADLTAVADYNPGIAAARLKGGQAKGKGAQRECDLVPKGKVVERVIEWQEGQALGLEIVESDWPIHFMRWVTRIEPYGGASRVKQRLEYRVKFGLLGWVLDRLVMRRKITEGVDAALQGMIRKAEAASDPVV
jgi:hypothetical protein